jgi:hypothetical protein
VGDTNTALEMLKYYPWIFMLNERDIIIPTNHFIGSA